MGILQRLFASRTPPPTVSKDATAGHAGCRLVVSQARRGDRARVEQAFRAETDVNLRSDYAALIADLDDAWIRQWVKEEPGSCVAWLLAGTSFSTKAHAVRGSGRAHDVAEENWDPFFEGARAADEAFLKAIECDPKDPLPWGLSIGSAIQCELDIDERLERLEQALALAPTYARAAFLAMMAVTEKWGGSHDLMFQLAQRLSRDAPRGSVLSAAVPFAHAERWLFHLSFEKNAEAAAQYFSQPSVRGQIQAAYRRYEWNPTPVGVSAANLFAFCFWKMGERALAKTEFTKAGGFYYGVPWIYTKPEIYEKALHECW